MLQSIHEGLEKISNGMEKMNGNTNSFKEEHTLEERKKESQRIKNEYPDRIPIIMIKNLDKLLPPLDKIKYLCPDDLTMGQFVYVIRKRLRLRPEQAIYLFVGGHSIPSSHQNMAAIFKEHVDEDGFLYVLYAAESTFG